MKSMHKVSAFLVQKGADDMKKLTIKQKKFADEYIISGNATQAAIKAGYSEKTSTVIGAENLTKPNIKAYIDERMKELDEESIANQKEILQLITKHARMETVEHNVTKDGRVVKTPTSPSNSLKALELLGKVNQMFTDKVDLNSTEGIKIIDDIG